MEVINTISSIHNRIAEFKKQGLTTGFVPTMGALHRGHLSLVKEARKENDIVIASIFVNPIQFNNPDDLKNYPRDIDSDIQALESEKCDVLFHPDDKEMYPEPAEETFDFGNLDKVMEGLHRPGHFQGVATVVRRLFEIIKPKRAYFGMKDYQQVLIIHTLTKQLNLPVEIIPCRIVREPNGLAMSSRNQRLSPTEKQHAAFLYEFLKDVKIRTGYDTIKEIKDYIHYQLKRNKQIKLEYFEIVDMYSLASLESWSQSNNVIACIAAYVGKVRLIDNMILFS